MNGCPNINVPEWKALVGAVGEFEAYKDWMQYEDVRTPNEVLEKLYQVTKPVGSTIPAEKLKDIPKTDLENTVDYQLLADQDSEDLTYKGGQSYLFLNNKEAEAFAYLLRKNNEFPKEFKVTRRITKYERDPKNPLKYSSYNEYVDYFYIKSNKNKRSNLYDIVNKETGEVIASKVRLLHLSKDVKSKIAEDYGVEFKPTKVFSADRSISFALYRQKPSKAKYVAQAKKYIYDAIKFLNPEESSLTINLDKIESMLDAFPDEMWDYINTTYSPEDSTNINASISLQRSIKFDLPKLGLLQEIEKITGIKLQDTSFKNYDRTGRIEKILNVQWGNVVVIDYTTMTMKQLRTAISYYLRSKNYFKPSSEEQNVIKYAEHRGIDINELRELVFGDIDRALENVAYNNTDNSDEMEVSKWRESVRNYDWQTVELYEKPYTKFKERAKEQIIKKFKDKSLSNGISHLDYFFSGNFNWVNINFNNISGQYYDYDMETESDVGFEKQMRGILSPFEVTTYKKPSAGKNFLKESEVFNRLAAILHEPFHALHALSYGTKEELALRKAFDTLYNTEFGRNMLDEVFGKGYNNQDISYSVLYKEFAAFTTQLMLFPKQWIKNTDLRSNDIYDFIEKIQTLQDKTYKEIVKTKKKVGEIEKEVTEVEEIKLNFLEKLYNYVVSALNKVIPLSKKFFNTIADSKVVSKTVIEDVFGEEEAEVERVAKLPESVKKAKAEFLQAMDDFASAITTLMQVDSTLFSSDNINNFFSKDNYAQASSRKTPVASDSKSLQQIDITKFKKLVKLSSKTVSNLQKAMINSRVKEANRNLGTSFFIKFEQVGESDNYTWKIEDKAIKKEEPAIQSENKGGEQLSMFYKEIENLPSLMGIFGDNLSTDGLTPDADTLDKDNGTEIIVRMAEQLKTSLGVPYEMISEEDAVNLTQFTKNPYKGQPAFYHNGVVYFVNGKVRANMVFHEFAHPLVTAIRMTNPKLYKNLLSNLLATEEGKNLKLAVQQAYQIEAEESDDLINDEVIVRAIEYGTTQLRASTGFSKFIKDLMYAIKQLFRKAFGQKVTVQNLTPTTTLMDLSQMLVKGEQVYFEIITPADQQQAVEYYQEFSEYLDDMVNVAQKDFKGVQDVIDSNAQKMIKHINMLKNNKRLSELADILKNDFGESEYRKMKENIGRFSTLINERADLLDKDIKYMRNASSALLNSLLNLDAIVGKIERHLATLNLNDRATIYKASYYNEFLNDWSDFLEKGEELLRNNRQFIPRDHPVAQLIDRIRRTIGDAQKTIKDIDYAGTKDLLTIQLNDAMENIDRRYKEIFDHLEKIKAPEAQFKKWKAEYEKVRLTPKKIEETLKGNRGDANPLNSFLEGYLYNTDPVIGGFASFVKDNITDYMVRGQAKHYAFVDKIMPLLEKWGDYNPKRPGELGEKVGFLDKVGIYDDETGEFKMHEVWTLLNAFKDWRYDKSKFHNEIEELTKKYNLSNTKEDRDNLVAKKYEFKKLLRDYFHQEYIPEYYRRLDMLDKDDIGIELSQRIDDIFYKMSLLLEPSSSQEDLLGVMDQIGKLWRDYYRLSSETDIKGNPKTGLDLEVAKRMQEYKEAGKDMFDFVPKPGAFQDAYERYEQEVLNNYSKSFKGAEAFKNSMEFEFYMDSFVKRNTRTVLTKEFWEERERLYNELSRLIDKSGDADLYDKLDQLRKDLAGYTSGFKDEDNQIIVPEMSVDLIDKIKAAEEEIEKTKEQIRISKKGEGRKNAQAIREKLEEIDELQYYELTDYYIDTFNEYLMNIDSPLLQKLLKSNEIDRLTVDILLEKPVVLKELFEKSPEFKSWFDKNHIISKRTAAEEMVDPETGELIMGYKKESYYRPLRIWSVLRPRDPKYLETFTFVKTDGSRVTVEGLPSLRFYNRVVKDEYKTGYNFRTGQVELIVGVHIDNKSSKPNLPRLEVADKKYINQRYFDLRNAPAGSKDAKLYDVLEAIKEYHLKNQEGLDRNKKLYYDYPRHYKNMLEILQTKDLFNRRWSAVSLAFRRAADFFRKAKDDPDSGLNPDDNWNMIKSESFDEASMRIPMQGLYALNPDEVSTDILLGVSRYMLEAEKNMKLVEISPYAQAIQGVLADPKYGVKDKKGQKKKESTREKTIRNFIEREFMGIKNVGLLSNNAFANKLSNMMFRRASFGFFALNFPSALKNQMGAKFQGLIKAASGQHFNMRSFIDAEAWSLYAMKELSFNIYNRGQKPVVLQVIDLFDPVEGRTKEKFAEGVSRTLLTDVANMSFFMNFRKWTELQASLQQFGAMMKSKKIMQNGKEISYLDAWEVRDGKLQLKDGIDATWGVTYDQNGNMIVGQEFKNFRNTVQAVMRDLNGAYDEFNQPEAQRYLIFRYFSYLRRFFTTMLMSRFGFSGNVIRPLPRLNVGYADAVEGYYVTAGKWLVRSMLNMGSMMPYATPLEKAALKKLGTEVFGLIAMSMLLAPLFGWDPDDEDRYEKLREKSGAMPFFGLTDRDPNYPFKLSGWLSNQMLNLMMQVRAENEQFLPVPGFGLDDYGAFLDIKSIAAGPTLKKYGQLFNDAVYGITDDNRGYYQRDVGPYSWQQEESSKFWNHLFSTFGLTGSTLDPATAIKNFQGIQARAR